MDGFKQTDGRPSPRLRTAAALGLSCAAAIATSGCAGSEAPNTAAPTGAAQQPTAAVALVRSAARTTLAAPAGVEFKLEDASAFGPSHAPVLGSGEFDLPAATGREAVDLGETGSSEPGNEQVLFLSNQVYLQPKGLGSSVLPKGREWVSATLSGSEAVSTNFPSFVLQVEGVDPRFLLSELMGGTIAAVPAGRDLVGGLPARRYLVTVDLAQALGAARGPDAGVLGQAIQSELSAPSSGGSARTGQTTILAWIDASGRVIQMRAAPPGAGIGTATMTLCCFGVPVSVNAPPTARVIDIAALAPSGERENNGGGDSDGG
jgi:hypothetical protein